MLSPLPRRSGWAHSSLCFTQPYQPSPKGLSGRPAHCPFRGLLGVHSRYGLHTRAVTVYRDTLTEGFSHFVSSMTAPVASGWSGLPGGICTHWNAPPFHGAHPFRTSATTKDISFDPPRHLPSVEFRQILQHSLLGGRPCSDASSSHFSAARQSCRLPRMRSSRKRFG